MAGPGLARQRVVAVAAIRPSGTELGSGYLIGPRTVLTAGHVVPADVERIELRFAGDDRIRQAEVVWSETGRVDAALLALTGPDLPEWMQDAEPVRFGRFVTDDGFVTGDAQGFPRARERGGRRALEPVTGNIPCGAAGDGRSHLVITGTPPVSGAGAWRGMSGAAVWAAGLLVGVVTADSTEWDGGRLRFQPIDVLAADPGFTRAATRGEFVMDAVELVELASSPAPVRPGSPAQLLRAESRIIDFHGRQAELARLRGWCDGTGSSVMLLHAQGGQGKTRLALELLTRQRALGWSCGIARADFARMAAALAREDVERALRRSGAPVLIMIDYAEAWRSAGERSEDPVRTLLRLVGSRADSTAGPIRILLVARSPGTWWAELRGKFTASTFDELTLGRLAVALDLRLRLYREALTALAARLADVPDYRDTDWSRRTERIATPDELWRPRFGHALTLYEQALADLLQSGPRPVAVGSTEDILLGHESTYWHRTAEANGLDLDPGPLREAVAAVTLFGASTDRQAANLVDSLPAVRQREPHYRARVVRWLAELYPDPHIAWGPLEPDRLGEYLIATVWGADDQLVELVQGHLLPDDTHRDAAGRLSDGQIYRMLIVLDRAAQHRDHLRGIQRTVFFLREAGRTLPGWPAHERHEYLRLGAQKARVPARYTDRISARFPAGARWRPRWAWWNTQRKAAKIFAIRGDVYVALVEIAGSKAVLAVSAHMCAIYDPDTGQQWENLPTHDSSTMTIVAAAHGEFDGELHFALAMSDATIQAWHHDGSSWWGGTIGEPMTDESWHKRSGSLVLHRIRGRPVAVGSHGNGSLTVWDLTSGEPLAVREDSVTAPHGAAADMAVVDRPAGPVLVTAHDGVLGIRLFDLERLELIAAHKRDACVIAPLPPTADSGSPQWRAVIGRSNGDVEIVDLETGAVIAGMTGHSQAVRGIRVELGGAIPMVVTASDDRSVITSDLRTGDPLGTAYTGHTDRIRTLSTGRLGPEPVAVTGGADSTVRIWNLADATLPEAALTGHTETITGVALVRDGGRHVAVTASTDRTVRVWNLDAGGRAGAEALPDLYRAHPNEAVTTVAVAVHDDVVYVITGGMDGGLFTLAPTTRREKIWLERQVSALDCREVNDRLLAAAGDVTGGIQCWDELAGTALGPASDGGGGPIHTVRLVMACGKPMVVAATDTTCTTIDPVTGAVDSRCHGEPFEHERLVGLELLDGRPTVLVAEPGAAPDHWLVRAIDLRSREQVGVDLAFPARVRAARLYPFGPNGSKGETTVLVCGDDYDLWVRSLAADDRSRPIGVSGKGGPGSNRRPPADLTRWAGSTAILIGGDDGELELVDGKTGVPVVDTEPVNPTGITVARLGGRPAVVVASGRRKLAFRDLGKGEQIGAAVAAPPGIEELRTIEVGGDQVVLGESAFGLRAWAAHAMTPVPLHDGLHHGSAVNSAVVSLDGDTVVITAREEKLRAASALHRIPYGREITDLGAAGTSRRVLLAAHTFRGRPIVCTAGLLQNTIRLWDLRTGEPVGATLSVRSTHVLAAGAVGGTDVLYVANVLGQIGEWPFDLLFRRPLRRLLRAPRPRRVTDCGGQLGATLIHPALGLVVASGSGIYLQPFDANDPQPIHLDAPVTGLALGDQGSIVVNTEQGIVLLDLDISPGRRPAG